MQSTDSLFQMKRHHPTQRLLIALAVLVMLAVVVRILLDPVAAWGTRRVLGNLDGFRGTFADVHVSVLPPAYRIDQLKVIESPRGRWDEPLLYVESARVGIHWRKLLDAQVVARAHVTHPKIVAARHHEEKAEKGATLAEQLEKSIPLRVDRFEVSDGEVLIAEGGRKDAPQLWLNQLDLNAVNLATRKSLMQGNPAAVVLSGRVQKTGRLDVEAKLDPFASKPTFTADAKLVGLDARELYGFAENAAGLHAERGTINLYAELKANEGVLRGGVKPMLQNLEVGTSSKNLGARLKAFLADTAVEVLSDDTPKGETLATVIPVHGNLDQPRVQLVPTVLGAVRNAFVVGLRAGFKQLPPPTAEKKEGVVTQIVNAFKRDEGPKAQPSEGEKKQDHGERQVPRGDKGEDVPRAPVQRAPVPKS